MSAKSSPRLNPAAAARLGHELPRRFVVRARLLARWLRRIVLREHWKPLTASMFLMGMGTLAEAASFLVAAQFLIHWSTIQTELPSLGDHPLLLGGGALVALLIAGALCGYYGFQLAVRTVLDFEMMAFAQATGMVRDAQRRGAAMSSAQRKELSWTAPRFMGRTILQCVGLGTSAMLVVVGAIVCAATFPTLSLILGLILLISSPIFIYSTMKATRVGHRLRETATTHSEARNRITSKWTEVEAFEPAAMREDLSTQEDFLAFYGAFGERLMISPLSRLLVNATLSVCIVASLMWMTATLELNTQTISRLVIFLIFLRVFFSGAKAIITATQVIASFVPYFLIFLRLDPRMGVSANIAADAGIAAGPEGKS